MHLLLRLLDEASEHYYLVRAEGTDCELIAGAGLMVAELEDAWEELSYFRGTSQTSA
jgi:hypothetical protein